MKDLPFNELDHGGTNYTQTNTEFQPPTTRYVSGLRQEPQFQWLVCKRKMPDMNQNNPFMLTYLKQFAILVG
jgi:hypothetical protein